MFQQTTATTQPSHPRLVGDDIIIGKSTILARRFAFNGCWEVEKPQPIALSRLLSMAYGKRISINDGMLKQFDRAFGALPRNLREVEQILSTLPAPLAEAEERVAEANRLLKDGVSPYKLETVMRGQKYDLRPAPDWAETLTLCDKGLVLGKGTVVLPLTDDGLELEGRETQVLALLSVARRGLAPVEMLEKLGTVCRAVTKGEISVAAIALSQLRQPPLIDWALGKSLSLASVRIRRGMTPLEVLRKAGFRPAALEKAYGLTELWRKFNPNHKPAGSPEGGQFCSGSGGGSAQNLSSHSHATVKPVPSGSEHMEENGIILAAYNGEYHDQVVRDLANHFKEKGLSVETSVPFTSIDGKTTAIADLVVKDPVTGEMHIVEVKTGENPSFTPSQQKNYVLAQIGGHIYSNSEKIRTFGLTPGAPLPPIRVDVTYYDNNGHPTLYQFPPEYVKFVM